MRNKFNDKSDPVNSVSWKGLQTVKSTNYSSYLSLIFATWLVLFLLGAGHNLIL